MDKAQVTDRSNTTPSSKTFRDKLKPLLFNLTIQTIIKEEDGCLLGCSAV
jgi:hypothetical protein